MKSQELSKLRDELHIRHRLLDSFEDQMQSEDVQYRTSKEKELLDDSFRKDIYECIHPVKCVMNDFKYSIWADVPLGVIWGVLFYAFFSYGMGIWSIGGFRWAAVVYIVIGAMFALKLIFSSIDEGVDEDAVVFGLSIAWVLCLAGGFSFY